ncbi:hypothetical protein [Alicyclobacillus dauci]|uniref:Uncharacterized protein n=1 Tax=Alicyclobacillus dauci TaxID=1475485 RepID=A0ABY6Z148_9BACL|nr:hypothetical protein [Alicyclobacillus dauci]WAH36608.1 hypothetical protein NZD86_20800 [Alicyclobacillus dauci]
MPLMVFPVICVYSKIDADAFGIAVYTFIANRTQRAVFRQGPRTAIRADSSVWQRPGMRWIGYFSGAEIR